MSLTVCLDHMHMLFRLKCRTREHHGVADLASLDLGIDEKAHRERGPAIRLVVRPRHLGDHLDHPRPGVDFALRTHDSAPPVMLATGEPRAQHHVQSTRRVQRTVQGDR